MGVVPCCHGKVRPQVADGKGLHMWKANVLNMQLRTENGVVWLLGGWEGANNSTLHCKKQHII